MKLVSATPRPWKETTSSAEFPLTRLHLGFKNQFMKLVSATPRPWKETTSSAEFPLTLSSAVDMECLVSLGIAILFISEI